MTFHAQKPSPKPWATCSGTFTFVEATMRDIEFVLGGNGFSGFAFYVIDFNQMRKRTAIDELVDAYITNDPHFPLARRGGQVYEAFRSGYRAAYTVRLDIADEFLSQIEALQDAGG
ncbi:uncharacterized protein BT62DRAFT_627301 [Guyanagaster necrorhizus]|uniref:Uncharacterized protein n=1 Tax=Guyanagaster necrorhizus TaxID=856835 RepID=A0A9P8ALN9_9AGAR|nr:uncharacterized protein BT62DRAFT_627301 [Guyanagaster necrorhizus MCA 3950]KAG7440418.1 hypothetical protein BT62DRAFT_627301 [Guyanagaster necrorhizus MCA 3950]